MITDSFLLKQSLFLIAPLMLAALFVVTGIGYLIGKGMAKRPL